MIVPIAKHKRPYIGLFRYGLDSIRHLLFNFDSLKKEFFHVIGFLNFKQLVT